MDDSKATYRRLLRLGEIMNRTGLSRSTIYALIAKGKFPKQILISERCVGWDEDQIQTWLLARTEASVKPIQA